MINKLPKAQQYLTGFFLAEVVQSSVAPYIRLHAQGVPRKITQQTVTIIKSCTNKDWSLLRMQQKTYLFVTVFYSSTVPVFQCSTVPLVVVMIFQASDCALPVST